MLNWRWLVVWCAVALYLFSKLAILEFHLGDPTVYWYMAKVLPQGILPYRDFFFADPPLLVLFLVPIVALVKEHLLVIQFVPYLLESIVAVVLTVLLKEQKHRFWWLAPVLYLGSFTITATSDYGTGMQLASVWLISALFAVEKKKFFWAGVLLACAALTKMYMGAAVLAVLGYVAWKKEWPALLRITLGGVLASVVVLVPFILLSKGAIIADIILHQFDRPPGLNKLTVLSYFFQREWLLLCIACSVAWWQRRTLWAWLFPAEVLFVLLFQDIYYAYLGILLLPLTALVLATPPVFVQKLSLTSELQARGREALLVLGVLWFILGTVQYWSGVYAEGMFYPHAALAQAITEQQEQLPLYGSHELVPLMALTTGRPVFHSIIDSNGQTFASGAQDKEKISSAAVTEGVLLLSRGELHPVTGEAVSLHQAYFSDEEYRQHCQPIFTVPENSRNPRAVVMLSACHSD